MMKLGLVENQPTIVEDPAQKQLDQEKKLRRILQERKIPNWYGYEPTNFNYFSPTPCNIQPLDEKVSLF
jgi:hypothetical protein